MGIFPGGCDYVMLRDSSGQTYDVWMKAERLPAVDVPAAFEQDAASSPVRRAADGVEGSKIRPGMVVRFTGGTLHGCSVKFEFDPNGAPLEYDALVRTEKTRAYFRRLCPASYIGPAQNSLQVLVHATLVP